MRLRGVALATILAALGPAAAAHAATTVGSDLSKPANTTACVTACTAFTTLSSNGAPVAVAPFDGVIVRWRVKAGATASGVALRTIRSAGTGSYTGVAASDPQPVPPGTSTFDTRIPVKSGDIIGADAGANAMLFATSTTTDVQIFSPQLNTFAHPPSRQPNRELLVNADIEHDADGDGYGDETQDLCPTDPSRHTACLSNLSVDVHPDPAPLTVGRTLTYTIKVANAGPSTAQDVGLVVNLPFSATPMQARTGRGSCSGAFTFTCQLGPIDANAQGTVVLSVRPEVVGTLVLTARTATSTAETTTDDNGFTSDVTVLPPTLRLLDARLSRTVISVGGRTSIRWYETDAATVNVKVQQITRRGHIRPFGSFNVAGRPGPNSVAFHGRVPRHRRLKPGSYRFLVSAATQDGRVAAPAHLSFLVRHRRG
jgi:Domain of unknown function DUF11